jgi:surface polysaccharide O-acyltransferase-like enzyme
MNSTGLSIIKTLGCMTAVTFFTIYNTWDRYDYDYHWILGLLTFISTIATPLFLWWPAILMLRRVTMPTGKSAKLKAWSSSFFSG